MGGFYTSRLFNLIVNVAVYITEPSPPLSRSLPLRRKEGEAKGGEVTFAIILNKIIAMHFLNLLP